MFRQNEQQVFNNFGIQVSLAICRVMRYTIGEPVGSARKLLCPHQRYTTILIPQDVDALDYLPH
mgnify:CR=1 FL=1